jgi:hypothetical protein
MQWGTHSVTDVEVAARLAPLAIDSEGVAHGGLHHKAVERCSKNAIVIVAVDQHGVDGRLLSRHSVHNPLSQHFTASSAKIRVKHQPLPCTLMIFLD